MKIHIWLKISILLFVFILSGCQGEKPTSQDDVNIQEPKAIIIKAMERDPRTNELPTILNEFSFDLDLDNEEEKIELYSVAGKDENGRMMWDDGQKWLLLVVDKNGYYPLFSEFVQLGQVCFNVSTIGEERVPEVNVIVSTHCGIEIVDFVFNEEMKCFEGEIKYRAMDKNQYFTSIPNY